MGLNCTHGAWDGSYGWFHSMRTAVAEAAGGGFIDGHEAVFEFDAAFDTGGLRKFLSHSDCEGEIDPKTCKLVADDLMNILDKVAGYWRPRVKQFADGCLSAHERDEPLEFR